MKPLEVLKCLFDVTQAIELLETFTAGKTLEHYRGDAMLRSAVERQFEIIGEALSQAARRDPKIPEEITSFRQIVAFRNRLIHAYASIDDDVVWGILEKHLSILSKQVRELQG
jgi:uncharacterized protein with HEPN domain